MRTHTHTTDARTCMYKPMPYNVDHTCVDAVLYRYPWHVVFTGIRILIDGEVFDGDYFMNDDNSGKYAGYK